MKINPRSLNLTPDVIKELEKGYKTRIQLMDYWVNYLVYDSVISEQFFDLFKDILEESVEKDEVWEKSYLGKDARGWEHIEQKLYKGPHPKWGKPNMLHLTIHLAFKKRTAVARATSRVANGVGDLLTAFLGVCLLDSFFPPAPGASTLGRDTLVGWGILEYMNAKHKDES